MPALPWSPRAEERRPAYCSCKGTVGKSVGLSPDAAQVHHPIGMTRRLSQYRSVRRSQGWTPVPLSASEESMNPTAPNELASAQRTIAQLQTALDSRVVVEQAKGVLSVLADVDVDTAFRALRKFCRDRQIPLQGVARDVVNRSFTDYNEVIAMAHAAAAPPRSNSHSYESVNGHPKPRDIAPDLVAWPRPSPDT